jgi:hypothetical protein
MEYTPILIIKENRRMPTCNRLELQTLGSQPIMPKNLPDHCSEPTASEGMASSFSNLNYTVKKLWDILLHSPEILCTHQPKTGRRI